MMIDGNLKHPDENIGPGTTLLSINFLRLPPRRAAGHQPRGSDW
jgi:hypothetical protein